HFDAVASKIIVSQQTQIAPGGEGLHQGLVPPYLCDFIEVDQRLDGLALEVVVGKFPAVRQAVIGVEPIVKQDARGTADSLVSAIGPGFDLFADAGDQRRGADARFEERKLIAVLFAPSGHTYVTPTFTVLVVSLPRMSMTLTTIAYSPGSG